MRVAGPGQAQSVLPSEARPQPCISAGCLPTFWWGLGLGLPTLLAGNFHMRHHDAVPCPCHHAAVSCAALVLFVASTVDWDGVPP